MPGLRSTGVDRPRRALMTAALSLALSAGARAADEPITLRFAWWGGAARHQATLKAIALFEQRHAGVKVKAEYMGFNGYLERLTTQVVGGAEPDVMQINWAWLAMFSKRGKGFADLNQYKAVMALDQFSAADLATGMVAGRLNALPVSYTARILLWNQAAFSRAGLALPRNWDELFAAGAVFQRRLGDQAYPLDGELYDMMLLAQCYVQQKHGTPFVDPTQARVAMSAAAALEWVQVYRRLVDTHVATPLPLRASLGGADKPTEQQQDWVVGNWAGNFTWDSAIMLRAGTLDREQKLALGDFPELPGAANSGMFGRPALMFAVGRNCKHAEMAARFVDFLLTDLDAARLLGRTRGAPSAAGPLTLMLRENLLPPLELQARQQIDALRRAGRIDLPSPLFEHARLQKFMREVFETVAYGKTTDQAASERLIAEGNALLRRIK